MHAGMDKVTITELAHKGDGVALVDGQPVFVDGAAPGDVVSLNTDGARAKIVAVHEASSHRVTPPCNHAGHCGGCTLQHLNDRFVADWKRDQIIAALAHRGIDAGVASTVCMPPRSRRRAVFAARRNSSGVVLGFHEKSSGHIVEVPGCWVIDPAITTAIPQLETLLADGLTRRGEARVSVTTTQNGLDVAVEMPGKPLDGKLLSRLSAAGQSAGLARLTWNGEPVAQWLDPVILFDGLACTPPAGGFLQAVEAAEAVLRGKVMEALTGLKRPKRTVDLFSGCGAFALPMARLAKVDAFDSDAGAVASLDQAVRNLQGLKPVVSSRRDLFRRPLLPQDLKVYDFAVIDPPRAGAAAQVEQLAASSVPVIASVSCNPGTFARDARTLIDGGYEMGEVTPVDQFRWSPHVELVAVFKRA